MDLERAKASAEAADEAYRAQEQMLAVKVTQRYMDVLLAREQVAAARRKQSSLDEVLRVAEKSFSAGVASRTDVDDARAMRDAAVADVLEAEGAISVTEQALASVTGETKEAGDLAGLSVTKMVPATPSMRAVGEWLEMAGKSSPEIAGARFAQQAAAYNESRVLMSRIPTLELVASKGNSSSDGESNIGYRYKTDSIGLQFTVPLYSSGGARAARRQAAAAHGKAMADLDAANSGVRLEIIREHSLVRAGYARIEALQTALDSASRSVAGNEKGIQAGTRNIIDLINARQRYFDVQADLLKARCQYVVATLKLKALAGVLVPEDMREVNAWLE
jgi:TolC family type I secretion outer membrane protein